MGAKVREAEQRTLMLESLSPTPRLCWFLFQKALKLPQCHQYPLSVPASALGTTMNLDTRRPLAGWLCRGGGHCWLLCPGRCEVICVLWHLPGPPHLLSSASLQCVRCRTPSTKAKLVFGMSPEISKTEEAPGPTEVSVTPGLCVSTVPVPGWREKRRALLCWAHSCL